MNGSLKQRSAGPLDLTVDPRMRRRRTGELYRRGGSLSS